MSSATWLFRRGTAAAWTAANPTLLSGEMGVETDTRKFKIGNGTDAWNDLGYSAMVAVDIDDFLEGVPTEDEAHKAPTSEWAFDHNARDATAAQQGHATAAQITKLDGIEASADVTDATNVNSAGAVMESDYNANTILAATSDNTPVTLEVTEQTVVGRITGGNIAALSIAQLQTLVLSASLPEDTCIILDSAISADGKYSGIKGTFTAGENLVFGEIAYLKAADGKMWKTDADAEATTKPFIAMALGSISADASGSFLLIGFIREDDWDWTVGAPLFIGATTAGGMTSTAPSTAGQFVRCVGQAISADQIWFKPDNCWVEVG